MIVTLFGGGSSNVFERFNASRCFIIEMISCLARFSVLAAGHHALTAGTASLNISDESYNLYRKIFHLSTSET